MTSTVAVINLNSQTSLLQAPSAFPKVSTAGSKLLPRLLLSTLLYLVVRALVVAALADDQEDSWNRKRKQNREIKT